MKLTIKSLERKEIATPNGREKTAVKVGIQANEIPGNRWASCFENEQTKAWKEGDVVEIDSIKERGKYLNIILLKKQHQQESSGSNSNNGEIVVLLKSIDAGIKTLIGLQQPKGDAFESGDDVRLPSGGTTEGGDNAKDFNGDIPF